MNKAVFFDRDGVLNIDKDLITDINQIELYNNAANIIAELRQSGFMIFVVTNQPVVARGLITETKLEALHEDLKLILLNLNKNAVIDEIAYCPCHPHADLTQYRRNCENRKPKSGMLLNLAKKYNIDLKRSYMVGDRISDIIAGHRAGCTTIQCLTGKHTEKPILSDLVVEQEIKPDYVVKDIIELEGIIL